MMRRVYYLILALSISTSVFAQVNQLTITRVQQMPNLPSPYLMRDWKSVATDYDNLAFSLSATGQFLPLVGVKSGGINYPSLSPILLQTYVGTNSANQAEAINIIPSLVGASLVGINKSNQSSINWVVKSKDFFNKANGQNLYLNDYSSGTGGDWWYDVMPNIFFYQLYTHYPTTTDFDSQFMSVADRWISAVKAMGGSATPWSVPEMNYRGWNFATMKGNATGVKEPEAAGGIGWLLYHAYTKTSEKKYLEGAQMCLEFLSGLNSNPSYELQLPYGAFIAAKMNAEQGTSYNIPKIINWCFDRGSLRGWGAIKGTWNGSSVDGLIGEANDTGNDYAFAMNGFQQAAALVPLIKYDKRFARDIAKWALNLANASRLFYSPYLPQASQDDFVWSSTYDPQSVIAYEALKEKNNFNNNIPLYGTGDAKQSGWAQTNLGLYGSSHVGYLGSIVETTNVVGILKLDVNKTDFFLTDAYPSYVLYNPYGIDQQVTLDLPAGSSDIYDAISETIIASSVSGTTIVTIKANEATLLTYVPAGAALIPTAGKLYLGNKIIDYHYGYDFSAPLRIKSMSAEGTLVAFNQQVSVYTTIENSTATVVYSWKENGIVISAIAASPFIWTVPSTLGENVLELTIESNGKFATESILFNVVEKITTAPIVDNVTTDKLWYTPGSQVTIICNATDETQTAKELNYHWVVNGGSVITSNGSALSWRAPANEGIYEITCEVTDMDNLTTIGKKLILVRASTSVKTAPIAYYPLDGDVLDYSGNNHDATLKGAQLASDQRGESNKAFSFSSGNDIIYVSNEASLNFDDKLTASCWVKLNDVNQESFILSHGSWEERWKISATPDKKIRGTIKTSSGTRDVDSSAPLLLNQYYHVAMVYTGYSLELYIDGLLDNFAGHTGLINTTSKAITFGRKDENTTNYSLNGSLDEVRIYDQDLSPNEIETLKSTWNITTEIQENGTNTIYLYPNPSTGLINILGVENIASIKAWDLLGREIHSSYKNIQKSIIQVEIDTPATIVILRIETASKVYYQKIMIQ